MAFQLEPITIAAIGSAGVTVSLVLFLLARRLLNRPDSSDTDSELGSAHSHSGVGGRGGAYPYPYPDGNAYGQGYGAGREYPHPLSRSRTHHAGGGGVTASPSTGHTTLVTPSTGGKTKLKKGAGSIWTGREQDAEDLGTGVRKKGDELVVVTYEDGLRKLGIEPIPMGEDSPYTPSTHHHQHPHHPHGHHGQHGGGGGGGDRWAGRIEVPPLDESGLPTPYTGGGMSSYDSERYRHKPLPPPGLERSPSAASVLSSARAGIGRVRVGTGGTLGTFGTMRSGTLKSTWLPSYYQMTKGGKDESGLGDTR